MNQILGNYYIKIYSFESKHEIYDFINNQSASRLLSLDATLGNTYYCCVGYNSLTKEQEFIISFRCDENQDNLNLLFWKELNSFVLNVEGSVYLINLDNGVKIIHSIDFSLIGLRLLSNGGLLILDEFGLKIIDVNGDVILEENFGFIEGVRFNKNILFIQTSDDVKEFNLF